MLVHQPYAQAVEHVVVVIGAVPEALVVVQLAVLEALQGGGFAEDAGDGLELAQVVVEAFDEGLVAAVHVRRSDAQAGGVHLAPLQVVAASVGFLA
ncbi:hypothetical protein D9M68_951600 [compost metagenome]